jgi:HEAT repeat protein
MKDLRVHWPEAVLSLVGLLAILVLAKTPIVPFHQTEPVYQHKPLSFWVGQLDSPNTLKAQTAIRAIALKGVPFLLRGIASERGTEAGSVTALGLIGTASIPALLAACEDHRDSVRLAALRAIAIVAPNLDEQTGKVVPELINLSKDRSSAVRYAAMVVLDRIGPARVEAIPALIDLLGSELESDDNALPIQQRALHVLEKCGPQAQKAVPTLTNLLASTNGCVRQEAALALWAITHDPDLVVPELSRMLSETNRFNRRLAAVALARIGRETILSPGLIKEIDLVEAERQKWKPPYPGAPD